jgi:hypothetical protein
VPRDGAFPCPLRGHVARGGAAHEAEEGEQAVRGSLEAWPPCSLRRSPPCSPARLLARCAARLPARHPARRHARLATQRAACHPLDAPCTATLAAALAAPLATPPDTPLAALLLPPTHAPRACVAQLCAYLGERRLHLVSAEETQMSTAVKQHSARALVSHVAALLTFARSEFTATPERLPASKASRIASRIMNGNKQGKKTRAEEEETEEIEGGREYDEEEREEADDGGPLTLTAAEQTLAQLRLMVGRVAVANVVRRAADVARLHHALCRERAAAYRRGSSAADEHDKEAAAVAVKVVEAALRACQQQWRAAWPPHRIVTLSTTEALQAAAQETHESWREGWARVRITLRVELPPGSCSGAYVAHCLAAACAEHATRLVTTGRAGWGVWGGWACRPCTHTHTNSHTPRSHTTPDSPLSLPTPARRQTFSSHHGTSVVAATPRQRPTLSQP